MSSMSPLLGCAEPIASWSHLFGAAVALLLAPRLLRLGRGLGQRAALGVFLFAVVFLLAMSGTYHLLPHETEARAVLRRLDHAGIWLLIAGTFTPVHILAFRGWMRWGVLGVIWACAITGLVLETVFFASFPETLGLGLYLGLGWAGLVSGIGVARLHGRELVAPLWMGGVVYSIGGAVSILAPPSLLPGIFGHHETFHVAVLLAIALHARFIADLIGVVQGAAVGVSRAPVVAGALVAAADER